MPTQNDDTKMLHCPAQTTLQLVSGKWKTRILWLLRSQPLSFGDLRRKLTDTSPKVLTEQLRQLESDGLIYRSEEFQGAVRVSRYGYTSYGTTLIPVLDGLGQWGLAHESRTEQ